MSFLVYPEPRQFKDWQQWGQLLVQTLTKGLATSGLTTGIPTALTTKAASAYGGSTPWSTLSPGEMLINTKSVQDDSLIFVFPQTQPLGTLYEDKSLRVAGVSFTIKSTDPNDTPDVAWVIFKSV